MFERLTKASSNAAALPPPIREVVIDTETTGLSPRVGHKIISISLVELFNAERFGNRLDLMLDPCRAIPKEATAVNGIRDEDVRGKSPHFAEVAAQIAAFIGDSRLVGYNLGFDLNFLDAEFASCGIATANIARTGFDVMTLFQRTQSGPRRRLRAACDEFGIDVTACTAHSARGDCDATALLYIALRARYDVHSWASLLQGVQVSVADYQGLDRYYDDDNLQAAWELFQEKDYEPALARALDVVFHDKSQTADPETLAYELACVILRRQNRLKDEQNLLWLYFRRCVGLNVTAEQIISLAVPPWQAGNLRLLTEDEEQEFEETFSSKTYRRPVPETWVMAERFKRVTNRLGKKLETNDERLVRCLAALPNEDAFLEVAVCLRKVITERVRTNQDMRNELLHLHAIAQQHASLYGTYRLGWDHPENKADARAGLYPRVVATMTTADDLKSILLPYDEVGYLHLTLLNKTDVQRLKLVFGEPAKHAAPRERHKGIWERYRRELRHATSVPNEES